MVEETIDLFPSVMVARHWKGSELTSVAADVTNVSGISMNPSVFTHLDSSCGKSFRRVL